MSEQLTVNDIVQTYEKMSIDDVSNLTPNEICGHLTILSARLWSIGAEILRTEQNEVKKWITIKATSDSNKEADMLIKITEEYAESKKAKYALKVVEELIKSLKKVLRTKEIEYTNY